MARLGSRFDATQVDTEQRGDYENLPEGVYRLEVSEADLKEDRPANKAGIKITYDVIEPEDYKGRKIFGYINIENPNVQAQEIGQKELAALCRAMEIDGVDDTDELKFHAFTAKVGLGKPSKDKNADGTPVYPAKNEIKRFYFPDEGNVPAAEVSAPANDNRRPPANDNGARQTGNASSASTAVAGKARPWGAKK